jgi:SAM-dependent methyltransferase
MKIRESGMPDEAYWESLFDISFILDALGIQEDLQAVVELGCGYGTFTLPVAQRIQGTLHTFELEPELIQRTQERAQQAGLQNIRYYPRDVVEQGYGLPPGGVDACLLFNILHTEEPIALLRESAQLLRPGGWLFAIHWNPNPKTPRGPSMAIRPLPEDIATWAKATGLLQPHGPWISLPPWHYGWRFQKME